MKRTTWIMILGVASQLGLSACKQGVVDDNYPILKASLEETKVSMNDLFSKVEIVPLETNDSCLLIFPWKVLCINGKYGVFDFHASSFLVFDEKGKFIRQIGRRGQGPGEYSYIYDVSYDEDADRFYMLSPFGEILCYLSNGSFQNRIRLPQKANYQEFEDYGKYWITWSVPLDDDEPGFSFISKETFLCENSWWHCNPNVTTSSGNLHQYDGNVYFSCPMNRKIYKVTGKDSLQIAYVWDFGSDNYSIAQWGISETKFGGSEERELVAQYQEEHVIPYIQCLQAQTKRFYYSQFVIGYRLTHKRAHLFYRKSDGKNVYFETTSEGLHFKPMYWGEDYVISISDDNDMLDLDIYKAFLSPSEYAKIANRKEDDNPFLLKCYYK